MPDPANDLPAPGDTVTQDAGGMFAARTPDDVSLVVDGKPWWLTEPPTPRKKAPWPRQASFSAHRVKLAHTCLAKFQWRYSSRRPDPPGPEALTGKLVHGTYQDALLRRLSRKREIPFVASAEELLFLFDFQQAQLLAEGEEFEVLPGTLEDARAIIKKAGEHDFKGCFGAEVSFTLTVSRGLVVGGWIDRIDLLPAPLSAPVPTSLLPGDPFTGVVVLWDYKTTQETPEDGELWYDAQAGLYTAWARRRWPNAREIRFKIWNLRQGKKAEIRWSEQFDQFALSYASSAFHLSSSGDKTATTGEHCKSCPYRDGDPKFAPCEAYQQELKKTRFTDAAAGGLAKLDLPELLRRYRSYAQAEKLNEGAKKDAKGVIVEKLGKLTSFRHGDLQAVISRKRMAMFDELWKFVHELAPVFDMTPEEVLRDYFRVMKEALDEKVGNLPDEKRVLAEQIVDRYQTIHLQEPSLAVRRIGSLF